jgi:phenylalanyl-tRNA synthetase beta chain
MKVSINTAQRFSNVDLKGIERDVLLKRIGEQLGAVEATFDYAPRYAGIYVARVVSSVDHPDSDHLHVCMIDDGGVVQGVERDKDGLVQVVCGAPNAREGITVAWLPPGSTVPKSYDEAEKFVLGKREIRGQLSNGMLASPSELGMYEDHAGILEIEDSDVGAELMKPGTEFVKLYGLDDYIVDCENKMFTHRPDCFGVLGVAREIAGISGLGYVSPEWYLNAKNVAITSDKTIVSKDEIPAKVPRFLLQVVDLLTVLPSPIWMRAYLTRVGIKPINNIVDLSNYYMQLAAQPTHAFDYDKVKALCSGEVSVFPRMAVAGERLKLLNGKEIELSEDDIVIATETQVIALAGIMGGSETEVDENTKAIVLETATFDMYTIRRSSMRHGLFTDAVTRNNKGQSPLQNDRVAAKIVADMVETYGAVAGMIYDSGAPEVAHAKPVEVSAEFINSRLGTDISADAMVKLLANVEISALVNGSVLMVTPPFWRTDLELKEDIVEEIGRLYGYDKINVVLPNRTTKPTLRNKLMDYKDSLRDSLTAAGANEVLTYSFIHGDLMRRTGTDPDKWAYHIRNAISPDLQYYRTSLLPSLIAKVQQNLRSDMVRSDDNEFAIYEVGKARVKGHNDDDGLPQEFERLALVFAADDKTAARKYHGSATYMAKQYLLPLLNGPVEFAPLTTNDYPITSVYEMARSATITLNGQLLGVVGEFRAEAKKAYKLPDYCAGFELDLGLLMANSVLAKYSPISTYPKTQQDITLSVPSEVSFAQVIGNIKQELNSSKSEHGYEYRLSPRDIFQKDDQQNTNMTFRIWLWHPQKTLKTEEVNALLDQTAESAKANLKAERV